MSKWRRILSVGLSTGLVLTSFYAGGSLAANQPKEIRIGYSNAGTGGRPLASGSIFAVAHQQKLLEEEFAKDGIKVVWNFFPGAGPATNEATAAGQIDFGYHGDLPLIVGRSTGLKHKIIFGAGRFGDTHLVVPSGSTAKTLADLKGKKIAVFKGTNGQLIFNRFIKKHGFSEKDFRVISLNTEATRQSLTTGDIDASITTPYSLEARGVVRTLITERRSPDITGVLSFWVTEEFEVQYPDIVQRVVNRLVDAAAWTSDEANRQAYFEIAARAGIFTLQDFQRSEEPYLLKERYTPLLDEYFRSSIQEAIRLAKEFKLIRRDVSTEGWFEDKYLVAAIKAKQLEGVWDEYDASGQIIKR